MIKEKEKIIQIKSNKEAIRDMKRFYTKIKF